MGYNNGGIFYNHCVSDILVQYDNAVGRVQYEVVSSMLQLDVKWKMFDEE